MIKRKPKRQPFHAPTLAERRWIMFRVVFSVMRRFPALQDILRAIDALNAKKASTLSAAAAIKPLPGKSKTK